MQFLVFYHTHSNFQNFPPYKIHNSYEILCEKVVTFETISLQNMQKLFCFGFLQSVPLKLGHAYLKENA